MEIAQYKPTERFSSVADDYDRYRPTYPVQMLNILQDYYGLNQNSLLADVGAGTGIFTELLLQNKSVVIAIEPNDRMREVCVQKLSSYSNFKCIKGNAEAMKVPDYSVDLITCAQAFHWFDYGKAIPEFFRVLKEDGKIALVWNERKDLKGLMYHYEHLLKLHCTDYIIINHKRISYKVLQELFSGKNIHIYQVDNKQDMNFKSFRGRLLSCSYCPKQDNEHYVPLMEGIERLFIDFQNNGLVQFEYETIMYVIQNK